MAGTYWLPKLAKLRPSIALDRAKLFLSFSASFCCSCCFCCVCGNQRAILWSWLSPFIFTWLPGIELRSEGFAEQASLLSEPSPQPRTAFDGRACGLRVCPYFRIAITSGKVLESRLETRTASSQVGVCASIE